MSSVASYVYMGLVGLFVILVVGYVIMAFVRDIGHRSTTQEWVVDGTQLGRAPKTISGQDIPASQNGRYGVEFTYLTWLFINDLTGAPAADGPHYWPVMIKGSSNTDPQDGSVENLPYVAAPGILIGPNGNKITIVMNTIQATEPTDPKPIEILTVDNIPMNKWFQLAVVLMNNKLDVYINGNLKARKVLKGIPKLNHGDLYVASNNGFDGFISNALYLAYAAPYYKIDQHFRNGPSQKPCDITGTKPPYLATDFWVNSSN